MCDGKVKTLSCKNKFVKRNIYIYTYIYVESRRRVPFDFFLGSKKLISIYRIGGE